MELSAVLTPAIEGGYIALNPETGTTTQGRKGAIAVLRVLRRMVKSQERKAKSKSHSFLVRRPTRRSRGRGVALWPVSP